MKKLLSAFILSLLITACGGGGGGDGTSGTGINLTGTWSGTYLSNLGNTTITFTIAQSGNSFSGSWASAAGGYGTVEGTISGVNITVTVRDTSNCGGTYTGTGTVDGNTINYNLSGTDCQGTSNGQGTVTKTA